MCPLCDHPDISFYFEDKRRRYQQCNNCNLVFVESNFLPTLEQETSEYALHQNNFDDSGYINYLSRIVQYIPENSVSKSGRSKALDFGCGPTPVLAAVLFNSYDSVSYYDPIFYPQQHVLKNQYDLIVCTEAIEHFHSPKTEWSLLTSLLAEKGILLIMTKRVLSKDRFATWHYKNDVTHVSFFSESTFNYLADKSNLSVQFPTPDIAVFRKQ